MLLKTEISMDKRSLDILVLGGDDLFTELKRCSEDKHGDENKFFYGAWDDERANESIRSMSPFEIDFYDFGLIDLSNMMILNGIGVAAIGNVNNMILPLSMITEYGDIEPITNK
ncbi:29851_t:CDS:2 [Gigaspora margarita]|uniref:29851_t:CDS:1 n=1 Tax=Gigaspora margarita TaxID=4874 RepID=A0ABN7V2P4_GIGMA|nr:29851_t:CDS:2 [Gigaspora margarita]